MLVASDEDSLLGHNVHACASCNLRKVFHITKQAHNCALASVKACACLCPHARWRPKDAGYLDNASQHFDAFVANLAA